MRQSHLYLIAAVLFLVAAALNLGHDGFGLRTGIYLVVVAALLALGLNMRKAGK